MTRRGSPALLVGLGTLTVVLAGALITESCHRRSRQAAEEDHLRVTADALVPLTAGLFAEPSESADLELRRVTAPIGLRVTLISVDGHVHADSWTPPGLLAFFKSQLAEPEIVAAKRGQFGVARRRSETTGRTTMFVAQVVGPVERPVGFLRLGRDEPRQGLPWAAILGAVVAAMASGWLAGGWARRHDATVRRHLTTWSELPPTSDLEAIAAEADRRMRAIREGLSREVKATRTALERVAEGVVLLDREGIVRFTNPAAVHLLGSALTIGHPLIEAVRVPEVLAAVHETLASGETRHTGVTGPGELELAVRVCALDDPSLAAVVVLHDVREERQLERARRALVADLAHELRTPLTVLAGLAEELEAGAAGAELAPGLGRQVARLRAFAEELEELARIESGQLTLHVEETDASSVAQQVVGDLLPMARSTGVTLALEFAPARLRTDPVRLAQVLANLVDNGVRYNRPGGHVTVRTALIGGEVRIDVDDDGIGIPAGEIGLVFQRFYRVRRQSGREGGSGLGLAIVKHLVRALGGTVNLASREGQGTTVTLLLPTEDRAL